MRKSTLCVCCLFLAVGNIFGQNKSNNEAKTSITELMNDFHTGIIKKAAGVKCSPF